MIMKITGVKFIISDNIVIPVISAAVAAQSAFMIQKIIFFNIVTVDTVFSGITAALIYLLVQKLTYLISGNKKTDYKAHILKATPQKERF